MTGHGQNRQTAAVSQQGAAIRSEALGYGDVASGLFIGGAVALAAGLVVFIVSPKAR